MILFTDSYLLFGDGGAQVANHPRIGYQTYTKDGALDASSAQDGFPALAAGIPNTYEYWRPNALPAWLRCNAGAPVDVDYMGIAAHTLGTYGGTFRLEYSLDNVIWQDASGNMTVPDDTPIFVFFPSIFAQFWRLYLEDNGGNPIPFVGVWYIGKVLTMPHEIYAGHSPINLSRQTVVRSNKSEGGQFLGRYIVRSGVATTISFKNLPAVWYRINFDPFVLEARKTPFFFAWRPTKFPSEVAFGWTNRDISPANAGPRDLMSVAFEMQGIGNYE